MTRRLKGIWAKVERADEHIENLKAETSAFLSDNIYRTVSQADNERREAIVSAIGPSDVALRFAVITGEIIHQLRSCLDHLVWQLVEANGKTPTENHQFPICSTFSKYENAIKRGRIKGVASGAAELIKTRQPYRKGNDFKQHPLWVLQELDNTDKHQLLVVVAAYVSPEVVSIGTTGPGARHHDVIGMSEPKWPVRPTEEGAELLRIRFGKDYHPDVEVKGQLAAQIALDKYGPFTRKPVIDAVQELREKLVGNVRLFEPYL